MHFLLRKKQSSIHSKRMTAKWHAIIHVVTTETHPTLTQNADNKLCTWYYLIEPTVTSTNLDAYAVAFNQQTQLSTPSHPFLENNRTANRLQMK